MKTSRFRSAVRNLGRGDAPLTSLLDRQLAETIDACRLARSVAEGKADPGDASARMVEIEHRGDALRNELIVKLAAAPVAPIDREDVFRLSRSIDEVLDNLRDFVREWDLFDIEAAKAYLGLLDATAGAIADLSRALQAVAKDPKDLKRALASKESAEEIRRLYDVELGRLFRGKLSMEVVKSRELLRRLDVVGLRLNEASDRLSDAAVKRWA